MRKTIKIKISETILRTELRKHLNEAADQILDQEYLQAVMSGDMKKAQQMVCNAFRTAYPNTTIVDNNGDPRILYHGDKSKKRYIFSSNTFFGETEEYAGRYTRGTGEVAKFFLNIQHPFDIRDNKARAIFTEYRNGKEPAQTDSGAMDWAEFEYDDLQEYLEDNYPGDYDGIIMDEGADGGYEAPVVRRGLSYVPFYPNQIKSAEPATYDDNNQIIPLSQRFTNNNDVRYEEE